MVMFSAISMLVCLLVTVALVTSVFFINKKVGFLEQLFSGTFGQRSSAGSSVSYAGGAIGLTPGGKTMD